MCPTLIKRLQAEQLCLALSHLADPGLKPSKQMFIGTQAEVRRHAACSAGATHDYWRYIRVNDKAHAEGPQNLTVHWSSAMSLKSLQEINGAGLVVYCTRAQSMVGVQVAHHSRLGRSSHGRHSGTLRSIPAVPVCEDRCTFAAACGQAGAQRCTAGSG